MSASRSEWSWGVAGTSSPKKPATATASTSRVKSAPTLFFNEQAHIPPASTSTTSSFTSTSTLKAALPPSSRRRGRASAGHGYSTSVSATTSVLTPGTPDPAQFLKLVKGVSKQADENAGMRAREASVVERGRQGVKQRTMNVTVHRSGSAMAPGVNPKLGSASALKGKERPRERDRERPSMVSRTSSLSSTPSSAASPAGSNYSFASGVSEDTVMTSPEPETNLKEEGMMPPPPVPHKPKQERLPALDVCKARERKVPPEARTDFPPLGHTDPQQSDISRGSSGLRMHPLLQQKAAVAVPPPPRNPTANVSTAVVPPPTQTSSYVQSQSQPQQRRGPPVLGMRRANTNPLPAGAGLPSSQSGPKKFKPPLLNPAGAGAQVKVEPRTESTNAPRVKAEPVIAPPVVRTAPVAAPALPVQVPGPVPVTPTSRSTQRHPGSSPWSDNSFSFEGNSMDWAAADEVARKSGV
ncbi:hypothetical protein R3P38DRAFT_2860179 [Favolaschia claudopus]|uniref:Uncharacterized protein n=1 Tax=Favolaschia claudopus TaxID=2862362 RepID=A0AAW0DMC1_9AGAR